MSGTEAWGYLLVTVDPQLPVANPARDQAAAGRVVAQAMAQHYGRPQGQWYIRRVNVVSPMGAPFNPQQRVSLFVAVKATDDATLQLAFAQVAADLDQWGLAGSRKEGHKVIAQPFDADW